MPNRAFVGQSFEQLKTTLAALEKALQIGSLQELRVAGIMTATNALKTGEVQLRYEQCRYELYLRVTAMDDSDEKTALLLQFTNPYTEKVMKVHSRSAVGFYGIPLPAPEVPPTQ